jgi:hypothetical protein
MIINDQDTHRHQSEGLIANTAFAAQYEGRKAPAASAAVFIAPLSPAPSHYAIAEEVRYRSIR